MYNKKLFIGLVIFLVFIFVASVIYLIFFPKSNLPNSNNPTITPAMYPGISRTTSATPTISTPPQEQKQINDTTVNDIQTALSKTDVSTKGIRVFGDYAVVTVFSKSGATDNANVVLKKESGAWTIIAGPGTSFDQDYLNSLNLPQEVAKEANNIL